jgi:hypothetical protein
MFTIQRAKSATLQRLFAPQARDNAIAIVEGGVTAFHVKEGYLPYLELRLPLTAHYGTSLLMHSQLRFMAN